MVVILVHWLIKKDRLQAFEARWWAMTIDKGSGLHREILTRLVTETADERFHTFSLGDPHYCTYINIGLWESVAHFDQAIGKYIPQQRTFERDGRTLYTVELEAFEFKLRERAVLEVIGDRLGDEPSSPSHGEATAVSPSQRPVR